MTSRGDTDVHRIDIFILNVFTNEELHKQLSHENNNTWVPRAIRKLQQKWSAEKIAERRGWQSVERETRTSPVMQTLLFVFGYCCLGLIYVHVWHPVLLLTSTELSSQNTPANFSWTEWTDAKTVERCVGLKVLCVLAMRVIQSKVSLTVGQNRHHESHGLEEIQNMGRPSILSGLYHTGP